MGPNLSRTYLGDYWADFHDSKVIWEDLGPRWARAWSFSPKSPREHQMGPNSYLWSEISRRILSWFSLLQYTLYRGHISVCETTLARQYLSTLVTRWLMLRQTFYNNVLNTSQMLLFANVDEYSFANAARWWHSTIALFLPLHLK